MTYLLDVNVLIALLDSGHQHHIAAHRWFGQHADGTWATCPITELAVMRIMGHPAYPGFGVSPRQIGAMMGQLYQFPMLAISR
jgi:uncharacterized protein